LLEKTCPPGVLQGRVSGWSANLATASFFTDLLSYFDLAIQDLL